MIITFERKLHKIRAEINLDGQPGNIETVHNMMFHFLEIDGMRLKSEEWVCAAPLDGNLFADLYDYLDREMDFMFAKNRHIKILQELRQELYEERKGNIRQSANFQEGYEWAIDKAVRKVEDIIDKEMGYKNK